MSRQTVGGLLLLAATAAALLWANSPWADTYVAVRDTRFAPAGLQLNLSTAGWAADGLLAIFFFTTDVHAWPLLAAVVAVAGFGVLVQRRVRVVALAAAGHRHLGAGARLRRPRHRRRGAARLHRPGPRRPSRGAS